MGLANTKTNFDRGQIIEAITSEDPSVRRNVSRMLNPNMVLDTALGLKPIHVAILADNVDAVKRLLANNLTDVNCRVQGQPCLLLAAYSSNVEVVKELLKRKDLDVNAVAGDKKVTALMAAVFDGKADRPHALRAEIVEVLLRDPRCDFQITDADNYTALTYAAHIGNAVVARQLLRNGRAARYSIDELIGDIGVAVGTGHEPVCDIIVEAMTTEQKLLLAKKISSMKQAAAQRANVEGISALLDQAHALLDGSAPATKTHVDAEGAEIAVGDIIKIAVGADRIKALQAGHGGWPDELSKVLLQKTVPAIIRKFDSDGDVVADFHYIMTDESEMKLTLNPKAVKLISKATSYTAIDGNGNVIRRGDTVEILDNEEIVKPLMGRYWNDQLKPMLGKPGRIMFFDLDGDVHVKVAQQGAYYVPKVLTLVRSVKTGDGMPAEIGDTVRITSSKVELERLQTAKFGGWTDSMENWLGKEMIVRSIGCNCFFETDVPECMMQVGSTTNNVSFWVNPKATRHLTGGLPQPGGPNGRQQAAAATPPPKVIKDAMGTVIHAGTVVSFIKDADQVQRLQAGKRGWSDRLLPLLVTGRLPGLVTALKADGDIEVAALAFVADDRETVIVVNPSAVTVRSKDNHEATDASGKTILRGNTVTLLESETDFRALQQGHGSWTDDMSSFLGKPIVIQFFDRDGDIVAMMGKVGNLRCFNPKATNKVEKVKCRDGKDVAIGSTVRVGVSLADFEKLQTEQFGGWGSRLPELVDRTLTVQDISCKYQVETKSPACTIKVKHEDRHFWLNPMAVTTSLMTGSAGSGGHVEDLSRQHDLKVIPFEQIKLEKKLGSGAFGTVYLSKWSVTRCAVKQIAAQDIIEGPERDRILQEAVTHSRLIHPHIVQFIGISLQPTFMYIVLKCVDGFNLDEIIFERKMKLTDAEKTVIAGQVCDVIRYLHEDARPKVIHQDIKPSNVLVENGTKQALITDFGISRLAGHSPADTLSNVTKLYSTTLSGTVMYMAPELMKPNDHGLHRKPNFESDIFALGATLAEFFSGRRLYGDDVNDMTTLLNRKASSAPPFAVDHVPVPYRAVLRRSLASEPGRRPTAGQLVQAFS